MKKILHYICVLVFGLASCALLALLLRFMFLLIYHVDIFTIDTYNSFATYWNSGGVLHGKDLLMIGCLFIYLPLCFIVFRKLNRYQFIRLITVPLNKIINAGLNDYEVPNVNIKNLKVEEKKTLEQVVQERIASENKKREQKQAAAPNLRQEIINKLTEK